MKNFRILIIVASLIFSSAVHAANPLDALKGMIGAVIGNTAESIPEGTWKYAGPAVTFKGDNALKNLQGLGKIAGGKFNAQWQGTGKSLSLTFDISKLVDLVGKIAAVSGKSSLSALSKMLESYDGVYAGFRLEKAD